MFIKFLEKKKKKEVAPKHVVNEILQLLYKNCKKTKTIYNNQKYEQYSCSPLGQWKYLLAFPNVFSTLSKLA